MRESSSYTIENSSWVKKKHVGSCYSQAGEEIFEESTNREMIEIENEKFIM